MNCEDVRLALVAAIEGVTPTSGGHKAAFRLSRGASPSLGSRSFDLHLALPPVPAGEYADGFGATADPMVAEWLLQVVWHQEDEALYGAESVLIVQALRRLSGGQIREVEMTAQDVLGTANIGDQADTFRALVWRVAVYFDARTP
jgi:hypothetical protein